MSMTAYDVERVVAERKGVTYGELMEMADNTDTNRDLVLLMAESLVNRSPPRLRRVFVNRETMKDLSEVEVSRLFALDDSVAARDSGLADVVYRPVTFTATDQPPV